jgi:hypothetical protein
MKYHLICLAMLSACASFAQNTAKAPSLNVYLDANFPPSSINYLKTEVVYVNFVSDRRLSDVQVQAIAEPIQNGAVQNKYYFIGYGRFANQQDTVTWHSDPAENQGSIREKSLRAFKRGLLPFLLQTPDGDGIDYTLTGGPDYHATSDPWNLWTFGLYLSGAYNQSYNSFNASIDSLSRATQRTSDFNFRTSANAWKISDKWRIGFGFDYRRNHQTGALPFQTVNNAAVTYDANAVRSINDHWSAGGYAHLNQQGINLQNLDLIALAGVEYNFFPYRDFFKRRLLVGFNTGIDYSHDNSGHTTATSQNLSVAYAIIEKWGFLNASANAGYNHHINYDFLSAGLGINLGINLSKNLLLNFNYNYAVSHTTQNSSLTKVTYDHGYFSNASTVGIAYYFGSGYRSIVNPRLGVVN